MSTLKSLHEVLRELENAGHTELWMASPRGRTCFESHPNDQSQWYRPNIITRDGRTVAHREKRPDGWLLSADWKNTICHLGAAAPLDASFLDEGWRFQLVDMR
ncbi:TPA: hypothetical protein ACNV0U_005330 [Klebsiella variicola]|uniref:hypothetical protein n=1 Tax=Klebsiella variicola TaxID=244366 RepID=UPI001146EE38|nr:hypothetical protein [Klebsiella variicola]QOV61549.1 hypothetical protein AMN10_26485 [Klebsiella variicola]